MGYNSKRTGAEVEALLDKVEQLSGSSGKIPVIDHGTSDTTFELTPGVVHKWGAVPSLNLTYPADSIGKYASYKAVFIARPDFQLSLPSTIRWANDATPVFELGQYELSIEGNRALISTFMPTDSFFLDYVENEGTDYILTDYILTSNDYGFYCEVTPFGTYPTLALAAGTRNSSGYYSLGVEFAKSVYYVVWSQTQRSKGSYVDGEKNTYTYSGVSNLNNPNPLAVFGRNSNGTIDCVGKFRIHKLDIYGNDGSLRLSLRPYYDALSNSFGLFDVVESKFYPSVSKKLTGGFYE